MAFHPELQFTKSYHDHVPYVDSRGNVTILDTNQRMRLAKQGKALPDGSWPVRHAADLHRALEQFRGGHVQDSAAIRQHLMRRAAEFGLEHTLPVHWTA